MKRRYIYISILLGIFITVFFIFKSDENEKKAVKFDSLAINIQDSKDNIKNILLHTYYENDYIGGFSSATLTTEKSDLYTMYWTFKMIQLLKKERNYQYSLSPQQITLLKSINKEASSLNLNQLMMLMELNHHLNLRENKEISYKSILKKYSNYDKLFFWHSPNDKIESKMVATYNAIAICKYTKCDFDFSETSFKLIDLLSKKEFNDNIFEAFNEEFIYIKLLIALEYDFGLKKDLENRIKKWLVKVNNQITRLESNFESIIILSYMIDIYNKFGYNNAEIKRKLKSLDTNVVYNGLIIEPQVYYLYIELLLKSSYEVDIHRIEDYLKTHINSNFKRNSNPRISFLDNYYGLLLANHNDFNYEKIVRLVESTQSNDVHLKELSILELYYLYLTNKELRIQTAKVVPILKERFLSEIVNYSNIPVGQESIVSNLLSISFVFFSNEKLIDDNYIHIVKPVVINLLSSKEIKNSDVIFDIADLSKHISVLDDSSLNTYISSTLATLFDSRNGGFKKLNVGAYESDAGTTYKIVTYLLRFESYDDINQKYNINNFIKKVSKGEFFSLSPSNNVSDLRTTYFVKRLIDYSIRRKE